MKQIFVISIFTCFLPLAVFAQRELMLKNSNKGLYIEHQVAAKENFYSVGRLYDINAKDLASFNDLDMTKGLSIGQGIRIPITKKNFSQSSSKKGVPVYYIVDDKEWSNNIIVKDKKESLENIRKWNRLSNENVATGSKLVVGYLVGGDFDKVVVKNDAKKDEGTKPSSEKKDPVVTVVKDDTRPGVQETKKGESPKDNKIIPVEAGYFGSHFDLQTKSYPVSKDLTVTSGIFKTSSGWQDGKYYALIDKVEPGTIIRIINPINNKAVYAKVLGEMSGIRQNVGLNIRVSNAAAAALQVSETDKFIVKVNY